MKYYIRYIVLFIIICIIYNWNTDTVANNYKVVEGRSIEYNYEIWNPIIQKSVNDKYIQFLVDGKKIMVPQNDIYMDSNLKMMIAIDNLGEYFNCSSNLYNGRTLKIKKNDKNAEFVLNTNENIEKSYEKKDTAIVKKDNTLYVQLEAVARELDYNYSWKIDNNEIDIVNNSDISKIVPYVFDLREEGRSTVVKNQGRYGTCWAFASLTALATTLQPEENYEFSPDHMTLQNSFSSSQNDGGEYTMATAYLTAWQGPVLEADDPYGDKKSDDTLTPVKHVQEVQIIEAKDYEKIKEAIYKYGGVQSSLYTSLTSSTSKSIYYNREKSAYCYKGTEAPNHDIVIIGWDDNYSRDNFNMDLEGDGAFICQNSWGESFGENGVFYVSYYDTNIGVHNVVYTKIEDKDNYDKIYQADLCGWVGQLGYGSESVFFSNVYEAESEEEICAAGFYATGANTNYEIYYVENFVNAESLNNRKYITKGNFENAGYYTVDFEEAIPVNPGEKFAIVVYIYTPNSIHPAAIEYYADAATANVDLEDGEGYISLKGSNWDSVEETQSCNLCLKVYTNLR